MPVVLFSVFIAVSLLHNLLKRTPQQVYANLQIGEKKLSDAHMHGAGALSPKCYPLTWGKALFSCLYLDLAIFPLCLPWPEECLGLYPLCFKTRSESKNGDSKSA